MFEKTYKKHQKRKKTNNIHTQNNNKKYQQ